MSQRKLLTVFLGVYNGEKFMSSIVESITNQSNKNFSLVIVDNHSTDNSVFELKENFHKLGVQNIKLISNNRNFGGLGSLYKNLKYIKTEWFCTFHQDDFYMSNHVEILLNLIEKVKFNRAVVGVSTTMGSMNETGQVLNSKPRSSWFYSEKNQVGQFLQNVQSQSVPWPATAFRTEIFAKSKVPFSNPAFSDTEQTLKMLSKGYFIYSMEETMKYRENSHSESHTLDSIQREKGAFSGLRRIAESKEFRKILSKVNDQDLTRFFKLIREGLRFRILDEKKQQDLDKIFANSIHSYLENYPSKLRDNNFFSSLNQSSKKNIDKKIDKNSTYLWNKDLIQESSKRFVLNFWNLYFSKIKLPSKINKFFLYYFYQVIFKLKRSHRWKIKW